LAQLIGNKVKSLSEIEEILEKNRQMGCKIVHCHGVFDLLHPGHIRHIQEAKKQGDKLIVTVTPDRFVNKGPGRPAFNEELRIETLASLVQVDYVVLNDSPDAISAIHRIKPDIYAKGTEYQDHGADITGKISKESQAVEAHGGKVHYTGGLVLSSSSLLNRYFELAPSAVSTFIEQLKGSYTLDQLIAQIEAFSMMKVLIVGDAILDEYQYVLPLGQSGKGLHMTARCLEKETFLGGSLILANHIAEFVGSVTLVTALGRRCPQRALIEENLNPKIERMFIELDEEVTLTKKRYVLKDGQHLSKLFETYSYSNTDSLLQKKEAASVIEYIEKESANYDLVLVCDFGNGFTNPEIISALCSVSNFLAVNTQTNSGNRGFNVITHYNRADFISLNEPELRLAAHDRHSELIELSQRIASRLNCHYLSITRGVKGVFCYTTGELPLEIPAFTSFVVDRVGAGDSYFAFAAMCLAKGYSHKVAGFIGSLAAAIDVQIVGNREPVNKSALCKYLTRLMK
jgi:rfaE bifunctional protein nucleotidyltransferase chain/domain